jgi:sigma54-dependent transcription regulator
VHIEKDDAQRANGFPSMSHTPAPYAGINRIRFNGFVGASTSQAFARPPQGNMLKSSTNCCGFASGELSASITRTATLADGGRITERLVEDEIQRLKANWIEVHNDDLSDLLSAEQLTEMDAFDRLQLQSVIEVCRRRVLRRPGYSYIRVFARHRRVRRAGPTRLPDLERSVRRSVATSCRKYCRPRPVWRESRKAQHD